MSIAQHKRAIVRFARENNLSEQQEEQLQSILTQTYAAGSEDSLLDILLPEHSIKMDINKDSRIEQLDDQEYTQFYRWLTDEHVVEKRRSHAYDDVEDLVCNLVFGNDVAIDDIQDNIVDEIINEYLSQK